MPSAEIAVKIAQALNTTVEYLITGNSEYREIKNNNSKVLEVMNKYGKLTPEKKELVAKLIDNLG